MKTEKEKMLAGELYNAMDPQLQEERRKARMYAKAFNESQGSQKEEREALLKKLIPHADVDFWVEPPFYCDYGNHIHVGKQVFFNFNCIVLDVMEVTIGDRTLFGPNVQLYTANHPMDHKIRAAGLENGKPIIIGSDVWIGGGAIICPGVSIGDRTVIGAGSVVTRDIPSDVFAAGNPCKVIRQLESTD